MRKQTRLQRLKSDRAKLERIYQLEATSPLPNETYPLLTSEWSNVK